MNPGSGFRHVLRVVIAGAGAIWTTEPLVAQSQPATIPTVLALSMSASFMGALGMPRYVVGRTPPEWPASLVPRGARVVGGATTGAESMLRMQSAVFEFSRDGKPLEQLRALVTGAGYHAHAPTMPAREGFVSTEPDPPDTMYCKGESMVGFGPVDSTNTPLAFTILEISGEIGRQNCAASPVGRERRERPVELPALVAPRGVFVSPDGDSWSGSTGVIRASMRTTLPTDSVLVHYTRQLVAGGWTAAGTPAITEGIGLQRFTFRQHEEAWYALLTVTQAGERRDVRIDVHPADAAP